MANGSRRRKQKSWQQDRGFWLVAATLIFIFLLGGASRSDVLSLPFLRAGTAGLLVWLIIAKGWDSLNDARRHLWVIAAIALVLLVQLIPLPPSLWQSLPGRDIIAEIDRVAGLGSLWRPMTMVPDATWNALFSLFVPAAALAAAAFAGQSNDRNIVGLIIAIAAFAALLGVVQLGVGRNLPVYLYRITNDDSAVGLMANRNHHAMFLAAVLPLIALWLSTVKAQEKPLRVVLYAGLAGVAILVPLIIATGSRAGLLVGVVGLASAAFIYRRPAPSVVRRSHSGNKVDERFVVGGAIVALIILSLLSARYTVFDRLADTSLSGSDRAALTPVLFDMIKAHFPFGSGGGSFVPVFQMFEPDAMVFDKYYNHAHNDYLELMADHGILGLLLIIAAVAGWVFAAWRLVVRIDPDKRRETPVLLGVAGLSILLIFAIGSVGDYPIRVPSIAALVAISTLWVTRALTAVRPTPYK